MTATNGNGHAKPDAFWESYGFLPWLQTDNLIAYGPQYLGSEYDDWIPLGPSAGRRDRQDGRNWPIIRGEGDLDNIRWLARILAQLNPVAVGALEGLTSFMIGEGMTFSAIAKNKEQAGQDDVKKAIRQAQDVIDNFIELNEYDELQAELFWRSRRDGEYFLRYFPQDEDLILRTVEPEQVTENGCPIGKEWSLGIKHRVMDDPESSEEIEDIQTAEAYWIKYDPTDPGAEVPASEIQHVKINVDRTIKRGLTDFLCTKDALDGVVKLVRNLREGAGVQAAIVGFREHTTDLTGANAFQAAIRDRTPSYVDPSTGKTRIQQKIPPGTIMDVRGAKYVPNPWTNSSGGVHIAIAQAVYRQIGNRWQQPEYMISGDASNANYSSTLVSGSPFIRWCKRHQKFYKRRFKAPIWRAIELACELDVIEADFEELKQLIDIHVGAASPEVVNELEQAQVDWGDLDRGILSKKTRQGNRNLDPEEEQVNIKADPIAAVPGRLTDVDAQGNPVPGAGAPPQQGGQQAGFFPRLNRGAG